MSKKEIDIGGNDIDIIVDGQLILHIGQVSDNDTINLFLYPIQGMILKSLLSETGEDGGCSHEIISDRKK